MTTVLFEPGAPADELSRTPWLHADESCVVAVKPSGLLSVPGRAIADCHWSRLRATFEDLRVVHRLDMATSGLIVYARGADAQRELSAAFARRAVDKHYVCEVDGLVEHDKGEIDLPLAADWPNRPRQRVDRVHGRVALTRFRVLCRNADSATTRLALQPITGRSHQLRVHLCALGHPILGDRLYAPPAIAARAVRLLLHATHLAFLHPRHGGRLTFSSPAPF